MSSGFKYKGTNLANIFKSGSTITMTGYKINGTESTFLKKFNDLPNQVLEYKSSGIDIGVSACPIYFKYTVGTHTHTCNSNATGVYLILVGGGGGGASGGSNRFWSGAAGGGGGGGAMVALRVNKSNNTTIQTPITVNFSIGGGGAGGPALTDNGDGISGTGGGNTTASITTSGTAITFRANGGGGGLQPGVGAGGQPVVPTGITISNNFSAPGSSGLDGAAGKSGDDYDEPQGGNGGQNAYSVSGRFLIETSSTYGDGGKGGNGDSLSGSKNGTGGTAGVNGVAYIFEYFD